MSISVYAFCNSLLKVIFDQFFSVLVVILQTFCVGRDGYASLDGRTTVCFFLVYRVFSETIVILQTFCVRVENWACFVLQNLLECFNFDLRVFFTRFAN